MNEALVLLALVWAAVLVPQALRSRNASPHATVGGFERAMDVLRSDTSPGRQVFVPGDAGRIVSREPTGSASPALVAEPSPVVGRDAAVVDRRRAWFVRALAACGVSLLLAVLVGGWFWLPAVLTVLPTIAYVVVLRRLKLQRDEARRVVRELDLDAEPPDEAMPAAVGGPSPTSGTVRLRRWDG